MKNKVLIILISIVTFISCSTTKRTKPCTQCPSYTETIPVSDTITFKS